MKRSSPEHHSTLLPHPRGLEVRTAGPGSLISPLDRHLTSGVGPAGVQLGTWSVRPVKGVDKGPAGSRDSSARPLKGGTCMAKARWLASGILLGLSIGAVTLAEGDPSSGTAAPSAPSVAAASAPRPAPALTKEQEDRALALTARDVGLAPVVSKSPGKRVVKGPIIWAPSQEIVGAAVEVTFDRPLPYLEAVLPQPVSPLAPGYTAQDIPGHLFKARNVTSLTVYVDLSRNQVTRVTPGLGSEFLDARPEDEPSRDGIDPPAHGIPAGVVEKKEAR